MNNKNGIFIDLSEGMENCKMSGKNREKSGNFEVDDKWQPCLNKEVDLFGRENPYLITEEMQYLELP